MATVALNAEQEKQVEALKAKIRVAIESELDGIARLLVSREEKDIFGKTEFEVRDFVLKIGAKAFQECLREKKTATKAQA